MAGNITSDAFDEVLSAMCQRFSWHETVDVLIVGGAAGMVTGVLDPNRTTGDCDVISYEPEAPWAKIEILADEVGGEHGIPPGWFNSHLLIRTELLPEGWKQRRIYVKGGDFLRIYAASRIDLIAMKFFANRPQDLDDLVAMKVREDDRVFVRGYLAQLEKRIDSTALEDWKAAGEVLESWKVTE